MSRRLYDVVNGTVSSRPLACARIAVGAAGLVKVVSVGPVLWELSEPATLRVPFAAAWFGFPRPAVIAMIVAWALAATSLAIGWQSRAAAALLAALAWTTLFSDQQLYSNHLYLLSLLATLLALSDCGASLSLDARRAGGRAVVVGYPVALIRALVAMVYGFSALAKINLVWLSGGVLGAELGTGLLAVPEVVKRFAVLAPLAWVTVVVELCIAFGLLVPRYRRIAVACGLALHLSIVAFLGPTLELLTFALLLVGTYPLFFVEAIPRAVPRGSVRDPGVTGRGGGEPELIPQS